MNRPSVTHAAVLDLSLHRGGVLRIATAGMLPADAFPVPMSARLCAELCAGGHVRDGDSAARMLASYADCLSRHEASRRELIDIASVRDLVSGGLVHRNAWRFRITARQAAQALDVLSDRVQRDERYALALCRDSLPFSFVLAGDRVCIDQHAPPLAADQAHGFRTNSGDLVAALGAEFDRLWFSPHTLRDRNQVLAHLQSQRDRLFTRVIL